jgi:hypothetical protein
MKAGRADPAYGRRIAEAAAAHWEWTPEQIATCREMAADARPVREIARALGCHSDRVKARAARHGIDLWAVAAERMADASAVLRQHYATERDPGRVLALYCAARCETVSAEAMHGHAKRLGLHRPEMSQAEFAARGAAARMARQFAERAALAGEVQALLDEGVSRKAVKARLAISQKRMERMVAEGLVIVPPPPPKMPKPPRVRVRVRVRPPAPPPPAKPVVRRPNAISFGVNAERPKPIRTQSVEEWLASGGQITRLPTAAVCVTTATINEADAAAIRAHREAQEAELARHGGNKWKQARENSFRKMREARA